MDSRECAALDAYLTREPDPPICGECKANLEDEGHKITCSKYDEDDGGIFEEEDDPDFIENRERNERADSD